MKSKFIFTLDKIKSLNKYVLMCMFPKDKHNGRFACAILENGYTKKDLENAKKETREAVLKKV